MTTVRSVSASRHAVSQVRLLQDRVSKVRPLLPRASGRGDEPELGVGGPTRPCTVSVELGAPARSDAAAPLELGAPARSDAAAPLELELGAPARSDAAAPLELELERPRREESITHGFVLVEFPAARAGPGDRIELELHAEHAGAE